MIWTDPHVTCPCFCYYYIYLFIGIYTILFFISLLLHYWLEDINTLKWNWICFQIKYLIRLLAWQIYLGMNIIPTAGCQTSTNPPKSHIHNFENMPLFLDNHIEVRLNEKYFPKLKSLGSIQLPQVYHRLIYLITPSWDFSSLQPHYPS